MCGIGGVDGECYCWVFRVLVICVSRLCYELMNLVMFFFLSIWVMLLKLMLSFVRLVKILCVLL